MNSRSKISSSASALLLALALAEGALAHVPLPPRAPSEIGRRAVDIAVPNFTLTDQDGKRFELASTRGKVVLVTFIFTSCPDVCPLLTAHFASIQRALADGNPSDYRLLSITTDPERDTPSVLRDYGAGFKADFRNWYFLTGTRSELAKVWRLFGVNVAKTAAGQVQHTSLTTLIDRQGQRRVDYYGDKWQEKEILKDMRSLRAQKP